MKIRSVLKRPGTFLICSTLFFLFAGCSEEPGHANADSVKSNIPDVHQRGQHPLRTNLDKAGVDYSLLISLEKTEQKTCETLFRLLSEQPFSAKMPGAVYDSLARFHQLRLSLDSLILSIKNELIAGCETVSPAVADTIYFHQLNNPDETEFVRQYFLGPDIYNITGKSKMLKEKQIVFGKYISGFFRSEKSGSYKDDITPTDLYDKQQRRMISWEYYTFYGKTEAEALLVLDELRLKILASENYVYAAMLHRYQ